MDNQHTLDIQGFAPRFTPFGTDAEGRVYYASSAFKGKKRNVPSLDERRSMRKWSWFLAVWGKVEGAKTGLQVSEDGEEDELDGGGEEEVKISDRKFAIRSRD